MQSLCPNCGNPVGQNEVFCDKCGTRVAPDNVGQNQYQTPTPNSFQNQFQPPAQGGYQAPYQPQNQNNQYSYVPGQQNQPPYTSPAYNQYQSTKTGNITLKYILIGVGVIVVIAVAIFIVSILKKEPTKPTNNETRTTANDTNKPSNNNNKPTNNMPTESNKPVDNTTQSNNNNQNTNVSQASWFVNTNAKVTFNDTENKVYVDYSITLKNQGTGNAQNINVYFDPDPNDQDAKYVGVAPKTIVNFDGIIKSAAPGQSQDVKTRFYYSNIDPAKATTDKLNEIAQIYVKIPLYIEWQENGKPYSAKLQVQ